RDVHRPGRRKEPAGGCEAREGEGEGDGPEMHGRKRNTPKRAGRRNLSRRRAPTEPGAWLVDGDQRLIRVGARRGQRREVRVLAALLAGAHADLVEARLEGLSLGGGRRREGHDRERRELDARPHLLGRRAAWNLAEIGELGVVDEGALGGAADDLP